MTSDNKRITYLETYLILKTMYIHGEISLELFRKVNKLNAKQLHCKPYEVLASSTNY